MVILEIKKYGYPLFVILETIITPFQQRGRSAGSYATCHPSIDPGVRKPGLIEPDRDLQPCRPTV